MYLLDSLSKIDTQKIEEEWIREKPEYIQY